jgi:hypothetical protein
MSHWSWLHHPAAGLGSYGRMDATRYTLSSHQADEGVPVVIAEPQMAIAPGRDAWTREAERLRIVATLVGQPLDEAYIEALDVFDLRSLRVDLEREVRLRRKPRRLFQRFPVSGFALIRRIMGTR